MTQTRDIACTLLGRNGRYVQIALDTKGHCQGPTSMTMTPEQHGRRGARVAHDFMLARALKRRFGSARNMLRQLGFDEATSTQMLDSYKENEMPNYDRRRTGADRRRPARDGGQMGEDPVETVIVLLSEMSDEQKAEVIDALGGGDRRRASDPIFDKHWRRSGEDRRRAEDRRRFAHDQASGSRDSRNASEDFALRFPGVRNIRVMG